MIKPAYSVSFLLSINIFVWQNVLYFLGAPRNNTTVGEEPETKFLGVQIDNHLEVSYRSYSAKIEYS